MPSLHDLAKRAGVSPSTASRVMNKGRGSFPIAEKTRVKVLAIAKEIGYVPNAAAQALRRGSTRTISVIGSSPNFFKISNQAGNFHMEAMAGLMNAAVERGYHVNLLSGQETAPELGGAFADIGLTDGLLILNRDLDMGSEYVASLQNSAKPVMYVLDYPDGDNIYMTAPDDEQGGRLATRTLLDAGHRNIGFVRMDYYANIFNRRAKGWAGEMAAEGLVVPPTHDFSIEELKATDLTDAGITAVVCASDTIGLMLYRILTGAGIKVPEQVAIAAFTYMSLQKRNHEFPFIGVAEPLADTVAAGVGRLIDLIEKKEVPGRKLFDYTVVEGRRL